MSYNLISLDLPYIQPHFWWCQFYSNIPKTVKVSIHVNIPRSRSKIPRTESNKCNWLFSFPSWLLHAPYLKNLKYMRPITLTWASKAKRFLELTVTFQDGLILVCASVKVIHKLHIRTTLNFEVLLKYISVKRILIMSLAFAFIE